MHSRYTVRTINHHRRGGYVFASANLPKEAVDIARRVALGDNCRVHVYDTERKCDVAKVSPLKSWLHPDLES